MGGTGGETLRQVSVEGQGLAHTVSGMSAEGVQSVSYTHLTLPTIYSV